MTAEELLFKRFEQQAACFPERSALSCDGVETTYAELNARTNRLARAIRAHSGEACEPVALLLEHGPAQPEAIMAVLKAGKFYVGLEAANPPARLSQVLADAQPRLLVTNTRNLALARVLSRTNHAGGGLALLNLDELGSQGDSANLGLSVPPDSPICLAYTSGSTGRPKGVIRSHRTELRSVRRRAAKLGFCAADRFIYHTNYTFAMSFTELFGALLNGGTLCPYDIRARGLAELGEWLEREQVSVFNLVPSLLRRFLATLDPHRAPTHLRLLLAGGESLFRRDVEDFFDRFPAGSGPGRAGCRLVNYLGLSELAPISFYEVESARGAGEAALAPVPIGYPEPDVEVQLLDEHGDEVGMGAVGELTLKSEFLTPGYWRRPELNTAVFRPDPDDTGRRVFRTGDLGRQRAGGCLEYLGRKDFQAKIRGQTIQPAEVEAALFAQAEIADAVVVAHAGELGAQTRLVAYLVHQGSVAPATAALRARLRERLPDYMLPSSFMFLAAIPRNAAGKVDRPALPPPVFGRSQLSSAFVAPRTPAERALVSLWEALLGFEPVGVNDNFFDLGGDSLLAGQMLVDAERNFGKRFAPSILMQASTVAQLAARMVAADEPMPLRLLSQPCSAEAALPAPPVTLAPARAGQRRPLFFVPGGDGHMLPYTRLLGLLDPAQPIIALETLGAPSMQPHADVRQYASAHLARLRALQPEGPYLLAGACVGGTLAYEMAQQLHTAGQELRLLLLLDTPRRLPRRPRPGRLKLLLDDARHRVRAVHGISPARALAAGARLLKAGAAALRPAPAPPLRMYDWLTLAAHRYQAKPYAGRMVLLANETWLASNPRLGWGTLAQHGLDIYAVPGDHTTHLTLFAPATAQRLQHCIEAAQAGDTSPIPTPTAPLRPLHNSQHAFNTPTPPNT